ncbi:MAG: hypothetical protein P4L50_25170 [Anaerolineaceae bacterium]|nr:hypothetical protein [Anaerolineaceae bacterium]
MVKTVVLFDLDGVLIKAGGYRAAFHASMDYFLSIMGLNSETGPQEHDLVIFETYGVTAEWDMLPISLAILFEYCCTIFNEDVRLFNLEQAMEWVKGHQKVNLSVDYEGAIHKLAPHYWTTSMPAESVLCACQNGLGGLLFPHLSRQPLLGQLLSNTRSAADSLTTRILQNYQLGDVIFEQAFQVPAEVKTKSVLQMHDRALLSKTNRLNLQNLFDQKQIYLAYLTLRPSYPPPELGMDGFGYSPEAELALEKIGLDNVPLMAYGRMQYLAGQLQIPAASLVKPYPYQALAGIKAAVDGKELMALEWTGTIYKMMHADTGGIKFVEPDNSEIVQLDDLDIHIFEDMPVGIQSTRKAAEMLSGFGIKVSLTAWGIAYDPIMEAVLSSQGAQVYGDINQAIQEFLGLIQH